MLELYRSPVLNADSLRLALGYKSLAALYQSISKERIPIPVFTIENRKGKYALVSDVAKYLAQLRLNIKKVNEEVNHG
ncbi:MAG: hypothetical protein HWE16_02640 [Gammaproteobacteria bacterium]|nr:hypothetical protein [Gammaproteobacteria bacterium]